MNEFVNCEYRITQIAPIGFLSGMVFDEFEGDLCPQTERWQNVNPILIFRMRNWIGIRIWRAVWRPPRRNWGNCWPEPVTAWSSVKGYAW